MKKRLPWLLVNSYGLPNFTFGLMAFMATYYYAIFLTDVVYITAAHVATIMFLTHIADAISIPVTGGIIQKTQMRWGQFRSWLTFIPITTCIFFVLTFSNLPLSYGLKMVFLTAAYIAGGVSLNFAYNAHMGLISVLTTDVKDRLKLSSRNMQYGMASQILFSLAIVPLLLFLCRSNATWGYFYTAIILGLIQIVGYWNLFYQTRNYEKYDPNKKLTPSHKLTVSEMVGQVFRNKHLLIILCGDSAINLGIFSGQVLAVYYFKYVSGDESWMAPYALLSGIASFASTIIGAYVVNKIGKKNTYLFAAAYGIMGFLILRLYGASNPIVYIGIVCLTILGGGLCYPIRQAMFMDAAEYGYFKTGKDASAFIMSMLTLPTKIGVTGAGTVATAGLAFIGYKAGMEISDQFIGNLMDIICYIPVVCGVIAFLIMIFYSLSDDKLAKYMEANEKKRDKTKA